MNHSGTISKQFLIKEYKNKRKTIRQVTKELYCSCSTVRRLLIKYKLIRNRQEASILSKHKKKCGCMICKAKRKEYKNNKNFMFGKRSFNYIDGRALKKYKCIKCGEKISWQSGFYRQSLCQSCGHKELKIVLKVKLDQK